MTQATNENVTIADPAAVAPSAPTRTALVVDDEADVADAIAAFLRIDGFACDTAGCGDEALRLIETRTYDVIVSDLRMPGTDGAALSAWLDAHRPDLADRLAFVTGDCLSGPAERFLSTTRHPHMTKPFTSRSLQDLIAALERGQ